MFDFSVVIPCLNEAETLGNCIKKTKQKFLEMGIKGEVVVADNGSTDGSQEIALKERARVVDVPYKGYGNALYYGIMSANSRFILMGDADDSYDFSEIDKFYEKLKEGYEYVMGCRLPWGGGKVMPGAMPFHHLYFGNPALTFISKILFRSKVDDLNCGMRAFTKEAFLKMNMTTAAMEFASEMVIKASLWNLKTTQVPISLHKDGRSRPPHLKSWSDGWKILRFMLLMSPKWTFKIPGLILFFFGLLLICMIVFQPFHLGKIELDVNTYLVSAVMLIVGYQALLFSLFSQKFTSLIKIFPDNKMPEIKIDRLLVIGVIIILFGLFLIGYQFKLWADIDFGHLDYKNSLRVIIPAVILIILGLQTFFAGLFMGVLDLKTIRETGNAELL